MIQLKPKTMKTAKIKLEGLKIESFVTDLNKQDLNTVQGGKAILILPSHIENIF